MSSGTRARACAVVAVVLGGWAAGHAGDPAFTDQTSGANIAVTPFPSLALQWSNLNIFGFVGGAAVGDFDRNGWPDLYVLTGGSSADRLYINNGDGTFTDRAAAAGMAEPHMGMGAAVGDYDADGDLDIFVTSYGPALFAPSPGRHKLWRNNGDLTFTDVAGAAGVQFSGSGVADGFGAAFGDYDLDGDLDLVVPHWIQGHGNTLFENQGNGTFVNVSLPAGLTDLSVRSYSACFADMNGDRHPELLVAGDFGTSKYYVNNGDGTFADATAASGTGLDDNGMGHAIADLNGDGLLDWYVTSIHSPFPVAYDIPGTGNMLYVNLGNHQFAEISQAAGVSDGGWGWGTVALDVDHDGRTDLFETNGWGDTGQWANEACYLYRNLGGLVFADVAVVAGAAHPGQGRGAVRLDYDADGDQDLVVVGYGDPVALLRNDLARDSTTHWLRVVLDTSASPGLAPDGYGARVVARVGNAYQYAEIAGGSTYISQSELSAHFGLGSSAIVDELRVEWSDQTVSVLWSVPADQTLEIDPSGTATAYFVRSDCNQDGGVDLSDVIYLLGRLFLSIGATPECDDACDGSDDGAVDLVDAIVALGGLFVPGNAFLPPYPKCGRDQSPDGLLCAASTRCP
ncbi:MAG: CRTAC1 family protein [Planctomycetota bacterium]